MILELLIDYAASAELRKRFSTEQDAVLMQYSVSRADYECLRGLTPAVEELLPTTVRALLDKLQGQADAPELKWPGPSLSIQLIAPQLIAVGAEVEFTLQLGVNEAYNYRGQSYSLEVTFKHGNGTDVVHGVPVKPATLPPNPIAAVRFVCRARFTVVGQYSVDVKVVNHDSEDPNLSTERAVLGIGAIAVR